MVEPPKTATIITQVYFQTHSIYQGIQSTRTVMVRSVPAICSLCGKVMANSCLVFPMKLTI
jgi:hypothetical protein